jgi:hypothetical protein
MSLLKLSGINNAAIETVMNKECSLLKLSGLKNVTIETVRNEVQYVTIVTLKEQK